VARRLAVLVLAAGLLAGCGEKPEPAASRVTAVVGTLDLAKPAAAAGTRGPGATASTKRASLAFSGRVRPPTSQVTLQPARGGAVAVDVGQDGSFRARARGLRRGVNRFELVGRSAGLAPWKVAIAITRK
jgi:hypothetical protein